MDRHNIWQEDAVPRFRAMAVRGKQDCRTVGHSDVPRRRNGVDRRSCEEGCPIIGDRFVLEERQASMSAAAQSSSEWIAAYLDAVVRKDTAVIDCFVDPNVEYMVNGTPQPDPSGVLPMISEN